MGDGDGEMLVGVWTGDGEVNSGGGGGNGDVWVGRDG